MTTREARFIKGEASGRLGERVKDTLISAGLTPNEADVYLALLGNGRSSASDIVNAVGMHRTSVYSTLARLESKGMVSSLLVDGMRRFVPVHPRKLHQNVVEQVVHIEQLLPSLERLHDEGQGRDTVECFTGVSGLQSIHEMVLKEGKPYVGYGPAFRTEKLLKHYHVHFTRRAVRKRLQSRMVYDQRFEAGATNHFQKRRYLVSGEISPESVLVFGDSVALMLFAPGKPVGVVVRDRRIAEAYRQRFDMLWQAARE